MSNTGTAVEPKPAGTVETITTPAPAAEITPMQMLQAAVERGTDLDQLEKLMDLHERYEANRARKAYVVALAAFKSNPPSVVKDKQAAFELKNGGRTEYQYADLAQVAAVIGKGLSEHGLSHGWSVKQTDGRVSVTCTLTHEQGHSESVTLEGPVDPSGSKNAIQAIGSTVSYLERYSLLAVTGLAAGETDNDGACNAEIETITEDQIREIEDLIEATGSDKKALLGWVKVKKLADIPTRHYDQVIGALKDKQGAEE